MSEHAIYLFKSARRPRYRKENLNLLAAERGTVVEVAYNRSWVSSRYFDAGSIPRGSRAYFVFTDRPYSRFVPVRKGEIVAAQYDDLMLRLHVTLKTWVGVEDMDLGAFTRLAKQAAGDEAPDRKFVGPKLDGVELVKYYDEREAEGWRRAVEETLAMSEQSEDRAYARSVFFRPVGLQLEEGEPLVARRQPLEPGTTGSLLVEFHNPHLSDDQVRELRFRAITTEDRLRVMAPESILAQGQVELDVEVLEDDAELVLQVGPVPSEHTSVTERFFTSGHESRFAVASGNGQKADREDLLRLYASVQRNAEFPHAGDWLDLLDDFERLLPDEQRVQEDRALALLDQGRDNDAYRILKDLNPELLHDQARLALFRMHLDRGSGESAANEAEILNLTADGRVGDFLDLLEGLPESLLGRLLPELLILVPGEADLLRKLIDRVGQRITSPKAIAATARNLHEASNDPRWAYDYLAERRRELHLPDAAIADTLVLLAGAGGRPEGDRVAADTVSTHIGNLIERGEIEAAKGLLAKATDAIGRDSRDRLYHRVADRLAAHRKWDEAAFTMMQLAEAALRTGDLEEASDAVERARGLWASREEPAPVPDWIRDTAYRVERAWEDTSSLREWKQSDEERRQELLQRRFRNREILIVGGFRKSEWLEKIAALTAAKVTWAERYRHEGDDLGRYADQIRNGRYEAVVYYWQKTGHETGDHIKPACDESGTPVEYSESAGFRGVLGALETIAKESD